MSKVDIPSLISTARAITQSKELVELQIIYSGKTIFHHKKDIKFYEYTLNENINHPFNSQLKISVGVKPPDLIVFLSLSNFILWIVLAWYISRLSFDLGEKAQEEFNNLVRRLVHDLRGPLNIILKNVQTKNDSQLFPVINYSYDLIHNLLQKRLGVTKEYFNLDSELLFIIDLFKFHQYENTQISLISQHHSDISIFGDRTLFRRAVTNLLQNAYEARSPSHICVIEISVILNKDGNLILCIRDNGPGFPEKILVSQGRREETFKTGGTGLGLKSSIETFDSFGAETFLTNKDGALIEIKFKDFKLSDKEKNLAKKEKIILIDDDHYIALDWKREAETKDIPFYHFSSGRDFLNVIDQFEKDSVIYIDSYLNDEKGEEMARMIYDLGFSTIYLISSFWDGDLAKFPWIKAVRDKKFPLS